MSDSVGLGIRRPIIRNPLSPVCGSNRPVLAERSSTFTAGDLSSFTETSSPPTSWLTGRGRSRWVSSAPHKVLGAQVDPMRKGALRKASA